jgi:hypothetical protein
LSMNPIIFSVFRSKSPMVGLIWAKAIFMGLTKAKARVPCVRRTPLLLLGYSHFFQVFYMMGRYFSISNWLTWVR